VTLFERLRAASFAGATGWLNSEPLDLAGLRGQVVLVDFWTLTCINWLRTEPYVRGWWSAYRDDGLVVVGVHTPEFTFEQERDGVRRATLDRDIDYPVALDNDYAIWRSFGNRYWPALYFIDRDGKLRDHHFGEGRYEESERLLQGLLGVERGLIDVHGEGVEAEADWDHLRSPETYIGHARGARPASSEHLPLNRWRLVGDWSHGAESAFLERAGGSIVLRFHARDAHLVLAREPGAPIAFRVLLDGRAPERDHGVDVDAQGNGVLDEGRMYQLVRQRDGAGERTLEITFHERGAEAYVFTFG
jgi:hypothetical protein